MKTEARPRQAYNMAEAAAACGVTRWTFRKWIRQGKVKARAVSKNFYLIFPEDLDAFKASLPVVGSREFMQMRDGRRHAQA